MDLKAKLCGRPDAPLVVDFIAGFGGREVNIDTIRRIVNQARTIQAGGTPPPEAPWVDLNPSILP
jgi:hypothetical protein